MSDCPSLELRVPDPATTVSSQIVAPAYTLIATTSGEATVDTSTTYPSLTLTVPDTPQVTFYAVQASSSNSVVGVTRLNSLSGALLLTGLGNITITTGDGIIYISGSNQGGGQGDVTQADLLAASGALDNKIFDSGSLLSQRFSDFTGSIRAFTFNVPIGIDVLHVVYPKTFSTIPVAGPIFSTTGDYGYMMIPTNFTTSGFTARFSDIISEAGAQINTILKAE